jgi:aminomethyltransferase
MSEPLLKTPCHSWHVAHGGRMVDFAGWNMPVQYSTIAEEHKAVRTQAGLFDIAHMGRLFFEGPDAERFLNSLLTCNVADLREGQIRYGLLTNGQGGILDDILVYRFPSRYLLVVNASNRLKILDWIQQHQAGFDFHLHDETQNSAMVALQGPNSVAILNSITKSPVDGNTLEYYTGLECEILGAPAILSRTGYTGEDGFEIIVPADWGIDLWETLMEKGQPLGLQPAGLGCRDTLRLEAAMPLYGHELSENLDPFSAGVGFAVKLDKEKFVGQEALREIKDQVTKRRVGLELEGKRIAREGSKILHQETEVGEVTSGTYSPTLEKSIAMGYVEKSLAKPDISVEVEIRQQKIPARIVKLPFYRRTTG